MPRLILSLCLLTLLCTACVVPQFGGPDFSKRPSLGMSTSAVYEMWGRPSRCYYVSLRDDTEECVWRRYTTVFMPGAYGTATKDRYYDSRSVLFLNGQVVGGSF